MLPDKILVTTQLEFPASVYPEEGHVFQEVLHILRAKLGKNRSEKPQVTHTCNLDGEANPVMSFPASQSGVIRGAASPAKIKPVKLGLKLAGNRAGQVDQTELAHIPHGRQASMHLGHKINMDVNVSRQVLVLGGEHKA